jgi:hypothetical protein
VGVPPLVGVAVNVTEVPAQIAPAGAAAILTLAATTGLITMLIVFEVAGLPVTHARDEVILTVMLSPLERAELEYVEAVAPGIGVAPLYHWYEGVPPLAGVAVNVTEVPAHIAPAGAAAILTLAATTGLTTMLIVFEVAGLPLTQPSEEVIWTLMAAPLAMVVDVYVEPVSPEIAATPLYHWYEGVPPFVGVAVNVTEVPAHIAPTGAAVMLTLATTTGLTTILIVFEVAGLPLTQPNVDVIRTLIAAPFTRVVDVYVEAVSPGIRVAPLYHWYVGVPPLVGVAVNVTEVPAQIAPAGAAAMVTLAATTGLITMLIVFEVAGLPVTHARDEVILTDMLSPLERAELEYVEAVAPGIGVAPLYHWYVGVPPFVGVAVKVTEVPAHIAPAGAAAILTLAATTGLTTMLIVFEVAGLALTQPSEEVIWTLIAAPLAMVVDVYVEPVSPAIGATPLYHWYEGVPPLAGVAVNVTEVPAQIAPKGAAAMLTLAGSAGSTIRAKGEEVAWLHSGWAGLINTW